MLSVTGATRFVHGIGAKKGEAHAFTGASFAGGRRHGVFLAPYEPFVRLALPGAVLADHVAWILPDRAAAVRIVVVTGAMLKFRQLVVPVGLNAALEDLQHPVT